MPFAIVTGAASGIGRATSLRLAADGFDLGLLDIDAIGLERTRASVGALGRSADVRVVDLARSAESTRAVASLRELRPAIDALINDAGVGVAADVLETDPDDWDRILAVNLTAQFHLTRAVLPPMLQAGRGVIVNVASVAGIVGVRRRAAYCASKAGVIGLTRSIAADYAHRGIRAIAICPGTVATEWIDRILADAPDPAAARVAMARRQLDGRMGTPEEVAHGIAFLVSDQARFVNGSVLVMDGGMTAI